MLIGASRLPEMMYYSAYRLSTLIYLYMIYLAWEEEVDKLGGLPENTSPDVSCYVPEHSDQIRVEFVIPCDKGNFKVFINYFPDGSLYNYVIWKNETK